MTESAQRCRTQRPGTPPADAEEPGGNYPEKEAGNAGRNPPRRGFPLHLRAFCAILNLYSTEGVVDVKNKTLNEFKTFISRGNILDMAVGVIMGTAFSKIVTSIVNDIFMPLIGLLLGGLNFSGLSVQIRDTVIAYGAFIQNVIDFLIVAVCLFLVIRFMAKLTAKKKAAEEAEAKQAPAPAKSDEAVLLEEIRDLLKKESKESAE